MSTTLRPDIPASDVVSPDETATEFFKDRPPQADPGNLWLIVWALQMLPRGNTVGPGIRLQDAG